MLRLMLTDESWSKLRDIMEEYGIYNKPKLRKTVEGILYRMRTGIPWRDMPSIFGKWISIYQQFNRWSYKNKIMKIFKSLVQDPDLEWEFVDGSIVKAHQHSTGAAGSKDEAIGKSVGGNTTKIHMAVDAYGLPVDFELTGGEVHECKVAPDFFAKLPKADYVIADKGYDYEELRNIIRAKSSIPLIPKRSNSKTPNNDIDLNLYTYRHLVENLFARLKHFRAIATRYDKLKRNYASIIAIACAFIWLPM